uniref:t-SNARE coiled-coil homology domain-containing protein n=1 Tax=Amblyomma maculatum TaxID=34609 RepID=G3MLL7_AMBMU
MVDSDLRNGSHGGSAAEPCVKFPLRRVKLAVHRITKVAIPHHLDILSKQRSIIEKCQKLKQWDKLHDEQIRASLTVKQLKADLYELETLRSQVDPRDLQQFECLVRPVSDATFEQVRSFTEICLPLGPVIDFSAQPTCLPEAAPSAATETDLASPGRVILSDQAFYVEHIPDNTSAFKSWNSLRKDLQDLHHLVSSFSSLVHAQQEKVETIEENVTRADEQVAHSVRHLAQAAKLRKAMLPVTGALIGLTVAGPVGMVLGMKVALGCAVGAGFLGYTGGKVLQRRSEQDKVPVVEDMELKEMPRRQAPDESLSSASTAKPVI